MRFKFDQRPSFNSSTPSASKIVREYKKKCNRSSEILDRPGNERRRSRLLHRRLRLPLHRRRDWT